MDAHIKKDINAHSRNSYCCFLAEAPKWLKGVVQLEPPSVTTSSGTFPLMPLSNTTYEDMIVLTEPADECHDWLGKKVFLVGEAKVPGERKKRLVRVASGTVVDCNLPLQMFKPAARGGLLEPGHFRVRDVHMEELDLKFVKGVIVDETGKSHEKVSDALAVGDRLYLHTCSLIREPNME